MRRVTFGGGGPAGDGVEKRAEKRTGSWQGASQTEGPGRGKGGRIALTEKTGWGKGGGR